MNLTKEHDLKDNRKVLLLNDIPGFGKVAMSAMVPILSYLNHEVFQLPTAIISNTFNYGKFNILDTTDYLKETLKVWEELRLDFECVCTGYIASKNQADFICGFLARERKLGKMTVVDPIMADNGRLYNSMTYENVEIMRGLCANADIVLPNATEALYLTKLYETGEVLNKDKVRRIIEGLINNGAKSVIITSALLEDNAYYVCGYSHIEKEEFFLPYEMISGSVGGSGDIFSAVLVGNILNGNSVKASVICAMDFVARLIMENMNVNGGLLIEKYLHKYLK